MGDATSWRELCVEGSRISPEQAASLEAALEANPEDLPARLKLVGYYFYPRKTPEREARSAAHVHWLIEHHPEVGLGGYSIVPLEARKESERLWLAALASRPDDVAVLRNASTFFRHDPRAEDLVRRCAALEPASPEWPRKIGFLRQLAARDATSESERRRLSREAAAEYQSALALATEPVERYRLLIELARTRCEAGDGAGETEIGKRLIADAKDVEGTEHHGRGIHAGHIVLGHAALAAGDVLRASKHLAAAGAVDAKFDSWNGAPDFTLAAALLARGERELVIGYIEICFGIWGEGGGILSRCIRCIKNGETPPVTPFSYPP